PRCLPVGRPRAGLRRSIRWRGCGLTSVASNRMTPPWRRSVYESTCPCSRHPVHWTLPEPDPLSCRFDADLVVYRSLQTLLASEILFRRLHRDVVEQELDLLQFASDCVTQACTGPAEVVWRDFRQAELCGIFLHDMPDDFFCHAVAPGCSGF